MASTYSQLKIELIGTGEQSGTWGATTNTNLGTALEEAITGTVDVPFSSADVTLTLTNTNASQTARNLRLNLTGTVAAAQNLIVPAIEKFYIINNTLTYDITVKNSSGTGTVIKAGTSGFVFNNGTNVVAALDYFSGGAAITSGTINGVIIGGSSAGAITGTTITGTTFNGGSFSGTSGTFTSLSDSGNLTFTGTGNRILADFTNATIANRAAIQSSTTNGNTVVGALPNGTATGSAFQAYNNATPTNASLLSLEASSTATTLASSIRGSGTYLPMAFNVNGTESLRLLTTGAISFGSSGTAYGTSGQVLTSQGNAAPTWTTLTSSQWVTSGSNIYYTTGAVIDTRINPRSLAAANTSGTITPASNTYDQVNYLLTGTAAFAVPSGTPVNGQKLSIRLYAASTQTVSWTTTSTGYREIGTTLPLSVAAGKTVYVGCVWNSTDSFWDVVAVATQA